VSPATAKDAGAAGASVDVGATARGVGAVVGVAGCLVGARRGVAVGCAVEVGGSAVDAGGAGRGVAGGVMVRVAVADGEETLASVVATSTGLAGAGAAS
jgi:hypothetical protein